MKDRTPDTVENSEAENSFRIFYGKIFSSLLRKYGTQFTAEIEDAIQNAFYKSLKSWKPNHQPQNKENWLYAVAKNDLLNQIKVKNRHVFEVNDRPALEVEAEQTDKRLEVLLWVGGHAELSKQAKVLFILKHIFGLHVKEIALNLLLTEESIYKSIQRTQKKLVQLDLEKMDSDRKPISLAEIELFNEILYAVFNMGFDSFDVQQNSFVNEDLCIEALSLAKLLYVQNSRVSTKNLLALFCFHLARIASKSRGAQLVTFFEQKDWDADMIQLGYHYLEKPQTFSKYYTEAVIASKHMLATIKNEQHWRGIYALYDQLYRHQPSPVLCINMAYCLIQCSENGKAKELLESVEQQLPKGHFYFNVMKATLLKETDPAEAKKDLLHALAKTNQAFRKAFVISYIEQQPQT